TTTRQAAVEDPGVATSDRRCRLWWRSRLLRVERCSVRGVARPPDAPCRKHSRRAERPDHLARNRRAGRTDLLLGPRRHLQGRWQRPGARVAHPGGHTSRTRRRSLRAGCEAWDPRAVRHASRAGSGQLTWPEVAAAAAPYPPQRVLRSGWFS